MEIERNINKDISEDKHKVWIEKDNVIHVELAETIDEQEVKILTERIERTLRDTPKGSEAFSRYGSYINHTFISVQKKCCRRGEKYL